MASNIDGSYGGVDGLLQTGVSEKRVLGATPLYWAARDGKLDCISTLLDMGVDIGATTLRGETALYFAAKCGQAKAVLLLLDRGADIHAADVDGRTALHAAIEKGGDNYAVVSLLVERGADILAADVKAAINHGIKQQNIATLLKLKRPLLLPSSKNIL